MSEGLQLKIAFIVIIFFISIGGACLPIVLSKSSSLFELQTSTWFTIVRCFATGIVIGVAVMHLLAEAIDVLAEQADYPRKSFDLCSRLQLIIKAPLLFCSWTCSRFDWPFVHSGC